MSGNRVLEDMRVWQESRTFVNAIYDMMLPCKDFGFKDQIQRAAVSIMNNIAEGFESGSDALFLRYLNIAKGSCSEVKSMLYLCEDRKFCTQETRISLHAQLTVLSGGVYNLIKYLENNKNNNQQ